MKNRTWIVALSLFVVGVTASTDLLACGDKFLVPSRGTRFERAPAMRQQAAVLLYANPSSALPGILTRLSVDPLLRKAGYQLTLVTTANDFDKAQQRGGWDVVLIDLADRGVVAGRLQSAGAPVLLAVAQQPTKLELLQAKKDVSVVLKSPTRSQTFLDALDDAVAARHDAQAKAAKNAR